MCFCIFEVITWWPQGHLVLFLLELVILLNQHYPKKIQSVCNYGVIHIPGLSNKELWTLASQINVGNSRHNFKYLLWPIQFNSIYQNPITQPYVLTSELWVSRLHLVITFYWTEKKKKTREKPDKPMVKVIKRYLINISSRFC